MREMHLTFEGFTLYRSSFDPATGTLVRETEVTPPGYNGFDKMLMQGLPWRMARKVEARWRKKYGNRREAFSPSPETIDIAITNWCNFGCPFCYQDSTTSNKHAPKDLVPRVIKSFSNVPYQIAIGGGEPTAHPDLPEILHSARALGTVPNYTTAGHIFRDDVIEATNAVCGGVAMTYHAQKGVDWFIEHYMKLKAALHVQINVHVIVDKDAPAKIDQLVAAQDKIGKLNFVLLAYYPDVGRGNMQGLIAKNAYNVLLPAALKRALASGTKIAFSEGLLPYFISRPEIGIDTKVRIGSATSEVARSEGLFSCYVDCNGRMSSSSFNPPPSAHELTLIKNNQRWPTVYEASLQDTWNHGWWDVRPPAMLNCENCKEQSRCAVPNPHHYFICAYSEVNGNNPPLPDSLIEMRRLQETADTLYALAEADRQASGALLTYAGENPFLKARGWYKAMDAIHDWEYATREEPKTPNVKLSRYWQKRIRLANRNRRLTCKQKKWQALQERRMAAFLSSKADARRKAGDFNGVRMVQFDLAVLITLVEMAGLAEPEKPCE